MKPRILITAGDPLGIGPEVTVKALRSPALRRACEPAVIGDTAALRAAGWSPALCPLLPVDSGLPRGSRPRPTAAGGRASLEAVLAGRGLVKKGFFDALVTAPICKRSWELAGAPENAHTDLFRRLEGREPLMAFSRGPVVAALLTEHLPLAGVGRALSAALVKNKALLLAGALRALGRRRPRITLCALNPHAGEGGLLGREELRVLAPAAAGLRRSGLDITAPLPSDAAWAQHLLGRSDGILCVYHDQALVPLKLGKAGAAPVHWTWGLGFIRASPAHGTAFDIAGKKRADAAGMEAAVLFAARLARG